jgi:hypothetical protein
MCGFFACVCSRPGLEVHKYDVALSLVMRHYWGCFPPGSAPPELDDARGKKASKLKGTLETECLELRLIPLRCVLVVSVRVRWCACCWCALMH